MNSILVATLAARINELESHVAALSAEKEGLETTLTVIRANWTGLTQCAFPSGYESYIRILDEYLGGHP